MTGERKKFRILRSVLMVMILLSFALHLGSVLSLRPLRNPTLLSQVPSKTPIKLRLNPPKAADPRRIIETPQKETSEPLPKEANYGQKNHLAEVETKIKPVPSQAADDPGVSLPHRAKKAASQREQLLKKSAPEHLAKAMPKPEPEEKSQVKDPRSKNGIVFHKKEKKFFEAEQRAPRNNYEKLLNESLADVADQETTAGYQEYIDEKIHEGMSIDLTTQEYRFIGYFTSLRKAIELAWVYPSSAAKRGMDGKVIIKFRIARTGDVVDIHVKDSSGHEILDRAIVSAIETAAPFAPLPRDIGRESLDITGTFNYVLSGYSR